MRRALSRRAWPVIAAAAVFAAIAASGAGASARPPAADLGVPGVDYVDGRVLVKFAPGTPAADVARAHAQANGRVQRVIGGIGVQVVDVGKSRVVTALQAYGRNPNVQFVEVDGIVHATAHECTQGTPGPSDQPNDDLFPCQWALHNTGQAYIGSSAGTADADVDAPEAWAAGASGAGVTIAILDTGYDESHEDVTGKVAGTHDLTGEGIHDGHGHGTWTASIAAATTNNAAGIAGTAPDASLLIVKVLDNGGSGSWSQVADGITWAAQNGADIISMSLGGKCRGGPFSGCNTLEAAVNFAWQAGALLVAAAGNSGTSGTEYPAKFANVIAVAASDADDQRASFSNYGDVAAPGVNVLGAFPDCDGGETFALQGNGLECDYDYGSGTSASTPVVAGVAALVWGAHPGLSNAQVRNLLESTAEDLPGDFDGHGRVNACAALNAAGTACDPGGTGGEEPPPPAGDFSLTATGYKVRGLQKADLNWSGASSANVDIYRDGALVATTGNDGAYTDNIDRRGSGTYTYQVCEAGTATCSNEATVTY